MPQRFHLGMCPVGRRSHASGPGLQLGLGRRSLSGGGPWRSLRLGGGVGLWLMVLLPAAVSGIAEDLTQRVAVRYRLAFTGVSGLLAISLLDMTVPRLGLPWLDALLSAAPWLGLCIAFGRDWAYHMPSTSLTVSMVALIVCLALAHVALQVGTAPWRRFGIHCSGYGGLSGVELSTRHAVCR